MNLDILSLIVSYGIPDVEIDDCVAIRGARYLIGRDLTASQAKAVLKTATDFDSLYPALKDFLWYSKNLTLGHYFYGCHRFSISEKDEDLIRHVLHDGEPDLIEYVLSDIENVEKYDWEFSFSKKKDTIRLLLRKFQNPVKRMDHEINRFYRGSYRFQPSETKKMKLECFAEMGYATKRLVIALASYGNIVHIRKCLKNMDDTIMPFSRFPKTLEMYQLIHEMGSPIDWTHLRRAVRKRQYDLIKFLLSIRGDIHYLDDQCLLECGIEGMKMLISYGANVTLRLLNKYRWSGERNPGFQYLSSLGYF